MKLIMFDFDGVIVDTFDFCFSVTNAFYPVTREEYKKRFEGNINDSSKNLPRGSVEDFFAGYTPELMKCEPFPEVVESIKVLSENHTLVIISSTITSAITNFLEKHDLRKYFQDVLGNDIEKSKVKKIMQTLEKYKMPADQALFITDTLGDIREAERCSVKCMAVTWGFHDSETLRSGNPYILIEEKNKIADMINAANI